MTEPQKSRLSSAARLLGRVLEKGHATPDVIAVRLGTTAERIARFASGAEAIPLEIQLAFADYVIAHVPACAREGRRLRGHVQAAIVFESGETQRHSSDSRPRNLW
jgi:hypothetical protein